MRWFYFRWVGILLITLLLAVMGFQRYERDVASLSPEQLVSNPPGERVRVLGLVQGGSLLKEEPLHQATFRLAGARETLTVRYVGQDLDSLRELKALVVVGQWNPATRVFEGNAIALIPNYGFIVAAYGIGIFPSLLFLFLMERKVGLLYNQVKSAKLYETEGVHVEQG